MSRAGTGAAGLAVLIVGLLVVSACGRIAELGKPSTIGPIVPVAAPNPALSNDQVVAVTEPSVVKTTGTATGCQKILEGSGFVFAPHRVMTTAHSVAGADSVSVQAQGQAFDAKVVVYDPNADVSVLDVPDLTTKPLTMAKATAKSGVDALVLGYPGGGDFVAVPARIREAVDFTGPDIYRTTTVTRRVYTIRGGVKQGVSGGPLIGLDGQVLGMAFGAAKDDPDTGFVLTADQVAPQLAKAGDTVPVATGDCIS